MAHSIPQRWSRQVNGKVLFCLFALLLLFDPLAAWGAGAVGRPTPSTTIQQAWTLAQRLGSYRFVTQLEQTTHPAPSVANVGRSPQVEMIYLEGAVDRAAAQLTLRLWQNGGSLLDPSSALEIKVVDGQATARRGTDAWETLDHADTLFAPTNDPLAFLAAIKDVRQEVGGSGQWTVDSGQETGDTGQETGDTRYETGDTRQEIRDTGFAALTNQLTNQLTTQLTNQPTTQSPNQLITSSLTFAIDGPAFADYLRAQLEATLRARGELPPGVRLESEAAYRQLVGQGRLWIDADGLPRRLQVTLALPPEKNGDQLTAVIRTDFSGFDRARLAPLTTAFSQWGYQLGLPQSVAGWWLLAQQGAVSLLLSGLGLALLWLLLRVRRTQGAYGLVAITVIVAQLVTPLLQVQQAAAFIDRTAPQAATTNTDVERAALADDLATTMPLPEVDGAELTALRLAAGGFPERTVNKSYDAVQPMPFGLPLAQTASANSTDSDGDGLSDSLEAEWGSNPAVADSDADGLADGPEVNALGTDPTNLDSDGDGLADGVEVPGLLVAGKRWYPNPLAVDSNDDGLTDGVECPEQSLFNASTTRPACGDLDGDGTPNLFDDDNDGDGVPDGGDLAPEHRMGNATPFGATAPLALTVDGLTAGQPTYLDLQLRPADPNHLTYAMQVLDWPGNDTRGHIQRRLETTFATTANSAIHSSDPNAANGDLRLLPMLSVRIAKQAGSYGNLPTKANPPALTAASTVADWIGALDREKLSAYNMSVREYDANTLELLTPLYLQPDSQGNPAAFSAHLLYWPTTSSWGAAQEVRLTWVIQLISDRCVDPEREGEAFCNNPANRRDEPTIIHAYEDEWQLTGLTVAEQRGTTVAVVRGATDRTVDENLWQLGNELANTFVGGRDRNNDGQRDLPIAEIARRWQKGSTATAADRLQIPVGSTDVTTFAYAHSDEYIQVMMTELRTILAPFPTNIAPTLLVTSEQQRRDLTLAEATVNGQAATFTFTAATPLKTTANVAWSPYRYANGGWENYPVADYLNDVLTPALATNPYFVPASSALADRNEANGRVDVARAIYLTLQHGYGALVGYADQLLKIAPTAVAPTAPGTNTSPLAKLVADYRYELTFVGRFYAARQLLTSYGYARGAGGFGAAVVATTLIVGEFTGDRRITHAVTGAVSSVLGVALGVRLTQLYRQVNTLQNGAFNLVKLRAYTAEINTLTRSISKSFKGLLIGLALAWGGYAAQGLLSGTWDDPALLGTAAATSTIAFFLFAVTLVAGPLVGAAVGLALLLFDGVVMLLCGFAGVSGAICGGLTGLLASLFYEVNHFVDLEDPDRLQIEDVGITLGDPNRGMVAGNSLTYRVYVFNGLRAAGNPYSLGGWVRRSTFAYSLDAQVRALHGDLALGQMTNNWNFNAQSTRFEQRATPAHTVALNTPGINVAGSLYLNEGFAVPYEECYKIFGIGVKCDTETLRDSNPINLSDLTILDILPATLAGFMQLESRGNGTYGLAWAQQWPIALSQLSGWGW